MDATPTRHAGLLRTLLLSAAALIALLSAATVHAQEVTAPDPEAPPDALEIIAVTHSPDGTIEVSAGAGPQGATIDRFNAFVDNVRVTIRSVEVPFREPAAIVIAIDSSGSMAGAPIASAKDAAQRLVERLEPRDSVAIVSFAATPKVLSEFTTNRVVLQSVLQGIVAEGETTLYDAVSLSSEMLAEQPGGGPHVLVLLSDGQDSDGAGAPGRQASLTAAADSGAAVHAFALGDDADEAYLGALASSTAGTLARVASDESLGALFESLGSRLAANYEFEIVAPPLALGRHSIELLAFLDGTPIEQSSSFEVDNAGLLVPELTSSSEPELVVVDVNTVLPAELLRIEASIDGSPVTYSNGQVFVDAWLVTPGEHSVQIDAFVADALAGSASITVNVLPLETEFQVTVDTVAVPPQLRVSARAQGPGPHTLRILADGEELLTTEERDTQIAYPTDREVTVEFVDAQGNLLASEVLAADLPEPADGGGGGLGLTYPLVAVAVVALGTIAAFFLRSRRQQSHPSYRALHRFSTPREMPSRPTHSGPLGTIRVTGPDGSDQSVSIGPRPITIGSSANCDLVIEGEGIHPLHARVTARGNGEFQIHGLAARSANPYGDGGGEEWVVLHAGESIGLGDYQITITEAEETQHAESA